MKKLYFLPNEESKRVLWFNNFSDKLKNVYATLFGISSTDADKIVAYASFYAFLISYLESLRTFSQDLTKYKNDFWNAALNTPNAALPTFSITPPATTPAEAGVYTIISNVIQTIKSHKSYTTSIGEDLGIVGNEQELDLDNLQVEIAASEQIDGVKITFKKKGADGVDIYGNPIGKFSTIEWELLGRDFHSPYLDSRPAEKAGVPEQRRYMARPVIGDAQVGKDSKPVTVTFAPAVISGGRPVVN
jgi:hypothetical protein